MICNIIFDLDGTLWNPAIAIANAWNRVLVRNAIDFRKITGEDIRSICGLPHEQCVRTIFRELSESNIQLLNRETQQEDQNIFADRPLPIFSGVAEAIPRLSKNFSLYIVSNCQRGYIENFLEASCLEPYFCDWECWGNTGSAKPDNLRALLEANGCQNAVFVGDTEGDEEAAAACRVPYFHAAYGYGCALRPQRIFKTFQELTTYFLGLR